MPFPLWNGIAVLLCTLLARASQGQGFTQRSIAPDHGTDPSRLRRLTQVSYGYLDSGHGSSRSTLQLIGGTPVLRHISLEATLPFVSTGVPQQAGLGDVVLEVNEILRRSRRTAHVLKGELTFDTANRPEHGAGVPTFQATYIYTKVLRGGLFAPSIAQRSSIGEDANGDFINRTIVDFYYVPRLRDPRHFMTVDPAVTADWEHGLRYASLAVTVGRVLGAWMSGHAQVYLKPSLSVGGDRPGDWGIEAGSQFIGAGS